MRRRKTRLWGGGACVPRVPRGADPLVDTHDVDTHDGGFALALVLLALVGMTTLAMAGFLRVNTDYRITQNHRASIHAFNVADAGRAQYLGAGKLDPDTLTYAYADGAADVWTEPLVAVDDSSTLYRVVSSGVHQAPEGGVANRRTTSVVIHKAVAFNVNAAVTAPAGLQKNGTSGDVDGNDDSTPSDCPVGGDEDLPGLMVPPGGFSQNGNGNGNGGGGSPPGFAGNPAIDDTQSALQMVQALGINWQGMLDGSFAEADYVVSSDGYPNFASLPSDEWPLILYDSPNASIGAGETGRGTLVFPGNVTFNGNFDWDGLILIGGSFTSNGKQEVYGSVVAGLNLLLGQSPGIVDLGNGNWVVHYNSCNVLSALKGVGWPVEEPHTWAEVF